MFAHADLQGQVQGKVFADRQSDIVQRMACHILVTSLRYKAACMSLQSFEDKHKSTGQLADMEEVKGWCKTMIQYLQVTIAEVDKAPIVKYSDTE